MQRTYYIKHNTINGLKFDKVICKVNDPRPSWHKVYALTEWKQEHRGYSHLRINSVLTIAEMKEQGFKAYL